MIEKDKPTKYKNGRLLAKRPNRININREELEHCLYEEEYHGQKCLASSEPHVTQFSND